MRIELNSAVCGQNRFGRAENVADVALIIDVGIRPGLWQS